MGVAIDTIVGAATMASASPALTALTMAPGDTLTVRNFEAPAYAQLEQVFGNAGHAFEWSVRSPFFYDNIRGFQGWSGELPLRKGLPWRPLQRLRSQDVLTAQVDGTASDVVLLAMQIYYSDIMGQSQSLASWGDIAARIVNVYGLEVDVTTNGTAGDWQDTVITTTVDQLKGNTDHAVLGYQVDSEVDVVGVKGQFSGSLRICGPGALDSKLTSDFFVQLSDAYGTPHIPVFNSADKGNTFVSTAHHAASATPKVVLMLAELA